MSAKTRPNRRPVPEGSVDKMSDGTEKKLTPEDLLRDEILADARRQAERVLRRARSDADALKAKASAAVEAKRAKALEEAKDTASHKAGVILAKVPLEEARFKAARIESELDAIHDAAREILKSRQTAETPDFEARLARMWPQLRCLVAESLGFTSGAPSPTAAEEAAAPTATNGPRVSKISGPIVTATGMADAQMFEVVKVGEAMLTGEVVRLEGDRAVIQVYEDTTLLKPGAPVKLTGAPLSVTLGPGLIGNIYDGIQRPLPSIQEIFGAWIGRGGDVPAVDLEKKWDFVPSPTATPGTDVSGGFILGFVQETQLFKHTIMVPPGISGKLKGIKAGTFTLTEPVATVETAKGVEEVTMMQKWPVRVPRPTSRRHRISAPLVTGQRIIDTLFPIGKGGTAAIPGGFGTGKTCTQHQLAKWSDADIIVYVGCGERGNEMTDVLREFPAIIDPKSGRPLMERTILIANTSNMPVAAREVSIYTGITLAEYFRDMGCSVAVFADSTSRWAEALRELAARLEEMPAEEGFPATLPSRLAQFYERAGSFENLNGSSGAISIVGAVSPPGGDFSEPVTQHTQRFIRCFWALDSELANARHYPSINWLRSYSEYGEDVAEWWGNRAPDWAEMRAETIQILQREDRLQQIVKLVGPDVLPDSQRLVLFVAEMIKDGFLTQSAFDEIDTYCSPERQMAILRLILAVWRKGQEAIEAGAPLLKVQQLRSIPEVIRAKATYANDKLGEIRDLGNRLQGELDALVAEYRKRG